MVAPTPTATPTPPEVKLLRRLSTGELELALREPEAVVETPAVTGPVVDPALLNVELLEIPEVEPPEIGKPEEVIPVTAPAVAVAPLDVEF